MWSFFICSSDSQLPWRSRKLLTIANEREPLWLLVTLMFSLTVFWDFLRSFPRVWSTISSVNRHLGIALSVSAPHWECSRSFSRSHTRGVCHRPTKCPSGRVSHHKSPCDASLRGPGVTISCLSQELGAWMWLCLPRSEQQQLFQVAVNQPSAPDLCFVQRKWKFSKYEMKIYIPGEGSWLYTRGL